MTLPAIQQVGWFAGIPVEVITARVHTGESIRIKRNLRFSPRVKSNRTMTLERSFELHVADLWDAVLNLSLPAEDQLSILEAIGDREAIDELALALDDVFWVVEEAFERRRMSQGEVETLRALNAALDEMSGEAQADRWSEPALVKDPGWERVRRLARHALAQRQLARVHKTPA